MFERFTPTARDVVVRAQQEARDLRHTRIGTEHLLLGVLAQPDAAGVRVLTELGVTLPAARAHLVELVGTGATGSEDAEALRSIGIDVAEVRRRVEARFGPGALDRPLPDGQRGRARWLRRKRRCSRTTSGHLAFMPNAKAALEGASRAAGRQQAASIDVVHIVLGLLDPKGNTAVDLLRRLDVDPDVARRRVLVQLGKAA